MKESLEHNLLENAMDSLGEGLRKYEDGINGNKKSFKFAILNISHFVELSFKFFISKINPILIYENPYSETVDKSKTISFWKAVSFYINLKEESNKDIVKYKKDINWLKQIRNDIEHHHFSIDIDYARDTIGRILRIVGLIYFIDCGMGPAKYLSEDLLNIYRTLIDDYKRKIYIAEKDAIKDAIKSGEDPKICLNCVNKTLTLRKKRFYCHFCKTTDKATRCIWCNDIFPMDYGYQSIIPNALCCSRDCQENEIDSID